MKWDEMRRSNNVQDVRGARGIPGKATGLGLGGLVITLLASWVLGVNPTDLIAVLEGQQTQGPSSDEVAPINDRDADFVKAVLGDTEDTWSKIFQQQLGASYQKPKLVLFDGAVNSACGLAESAIGPFYCPRDEKVYLDLSFFQQVQAAAGPNADFARAYAIAHEVGHHIQNELGIGTKVRQLQQQSDRATANNLSVRLELQADCLAGVWGHSTAQKGLISNQDIKSAIDTASQIGDDFLQRKGRGYVVPESFTHGSSEQRVKWFSQGLNSGDINQCNTFDRGSV